MSKIYCLACLIFTFYENFYWAPLNFTYVFQIMCLLNYRRRYVSDYLSLTKFFLFLLQKGKLEESLTCCGILFATFCFRLLLYDETKKWGACNYTQLIVDVSKKNKRRSVIIFIVFICHLFSI